MNDKSLDSRGMQNGQDITRMSIANNWGHDLIDVHTGEFGTENHKCYAMSTKTVMQMVNEYKFKVIKKRTRMHLIEPELFEENYSEFVDVAERKKEIRDMLLYVENFYPDIYDEAQSAYLNAEDEGKHIISYALEDLNEEEKDKQFSTMPK